MQLHPHPHSPTALGLSPGLDGSPHLAGGASFVDKVRLVRVQATDVQSVMHLREEIDLSAHLGREDFERLEKKETSAVLWAASIWTVKQ